MTERIERDSMGELRVPDKMLYGAQTQRAVENFPISGRTLGRPLIRALAQIKFAAAKVNAELGLLPRKLASAIQAAATEVISGELDHHFPVDIFQTGSGTSSNMNTNEVIANRAIQILGGKIGTKKPVHPNDHVNLGQSSNDVFPTAIHLALLVQLEKELLPQLNALQQSLAEKATQFDDIVKIGRTHLQDATPIRLGQEFSGYTSQIEHISQHLTQSLWHLRELPLGGTAVGTGINSHPQFGAKVAAELSAMTQRSLHEAPNHFEAQAARDAIVQISGTLKTLASALIKISNDIRFLGSGPRLGLGELEIPAMQPGSSIMPGKVNPVIAESLIMVCAQVIGNDTAITLGGLYGNFELNVMMPLIAKNILESTIWLTNGVKIFDQKLVQGLKARGDEIGAQNEQSLALATALVPVLGYDKSAEIAKQSWETGQTVRQLVREQGLLSSEDLDAHLDLMRLTNRQVVE